MVKLLMKKILILALLGLLFGGLAGCSGVDKKADTRSDVSNSESTLPDELVNIDRLLAQEKPKKAYKQVKKWIKENPDSSYMDQALFRKGQALFDRELYYQSFLAFDELLDKYPAGVLFEKALNMQVDIACKFLAGAKRKVWGFISTSARTEAIAILEKVAQRWYGSELAATALMLQGDYYFEKTRFLEAQHTYQMIIDNYRSSKHYEPAMLGSARATHGQYLGSSYDTSCLDEALIRYRHYRLQYPEKAVAKSVDQEIELIRKQQIQKQFDIADFYQRTGKSEAAKKTWAFIYQNWSDSDQAIEARKLHNTFQ